MDPKNDMAALVMAGGTGTRFWPLSRRTRPKQLLSIGNNPRMISATLDRIKTVLPPERILIITASHHSERVRDVCQEIPDQNIIPEPVGRDTAACNGLGGLVVRERFGGDTVISVLPADHKISPVEEFTDSVLAAGTVCQQLDGIVTFGIEPTHPATGYGYIVYESEQSRSVQGHHTFPVSRFTEKPDKSTASEYIDSGRVLWNSGMFFWSADTILTNIETHMPSLSDGLEDIEAQWRETGELEAALNAHYERLPAQSVDYAILERAETVWTMPVNFEWDDLGTLNKIKNMVSNDSDENVALGDVLSLDCTDSVLISDDGPFVAAIGLDDFIVVATEDALVVCPDERSEDVKQIVKKLEEEGRAELL